MIIVSGIIEIDPDDRDAALALTRELVPATLEEDGCISYGFWSHPDEPGRFRVFEEWKDQAALDSHFAQPHMAAFMAGLGELGVKSTELTRYEVAESSRLM